MTEEEKRWYHKFGFDSSKGYVKFMTEKRLWSDNVEYIENLTPAQKGIRTKGLNQLNKAIEEYKARMEID